MLSQSLIRAYHFHKEWSGYIVGQRAHGALRLARAELLAEEEGCTFTWEPDDDCDCDWSWLSPAERRREHSAEGCVMKDRDGNVLGSLWGIVDCTSHYARTVEAELALEAWDTLCGVDSTVWN